MKKKKSQNKKGEDEKRQGTEEQDWRGRGNKPRPPCRSQPMVGGERKKSQQGKHTGNTKDARDDTAEGQKDIETWEPPLTEGGKRKKRKLTKNGKTPASKSGKRLWNRKGWHLEKVGNVKKGSDREVGKIGHKSSKFGKEVGGGRGGE